jgi:cell division protein FtsL
MFRALEAEIRAFGRVCVMVLVALVAAALVVVSLVDHKHRPAVVPCAPPQCQLAPHGPTP